MIGWLALAGCRPEPVVPRASPTIAFTADETAFEGDPAHASADLFGVVVGDLELDGDPDVIISRHMLGPLELFENDGTGRFVQLNRKDADATGLYENPGVADLFVVDVASEAPGVYVWHDVSRSGPWRFRVILDSAEPAVLVLRTNVEMTSPPELLETEFDQPGDTDAVVTLARSGDFSIDTERFGSQLVVAVEGDDPLPLFVGSEGARFDREVSLLKSDPHGIAWVDAIGTPIPDLFVSRGALTGDLAPPFDPKIDRLYEHVGGATAFVESWASHASYDRGRQVMWIDVDHDGTNELHVANTTTPDHVLDPDAGFANRASELGLAAVGPDSIAWLDLDRDGSADLVHADGAALGVSMYRDGVYVEEPGAGRGLAWDVAFDEELFDPAVFRVADFDRDGDLDLCLVEVGEGRIWAFRAEGDGLVDATDALGLGGATGFEEILPLDVDNDGWTDLIAASAEPVLWHNRGGRFEAVALGVAAGANAAVADVDGDGLADVVFATAGARGLLRNETVDAWPAAVVTPVAPLGTVVRGHYFSGDVLAQSWGQAQVTRYHQGLLPLRFGSPGHDPLVGLSLQCPGCPAPTVELDASGSPTCTPCPDR
ncbi:MAG: VCBS repeat-containing protein [Deltaproteobacteria bacterium]|nr:VCBS repeat-containing protein [Deltaproteobacteria bacterium]